MAGREELLAEAQRRGLVPPGQATVAPGRDALLAEAQRRGLIPAGERSFGEQLGRQVGLAGRYAVEGALQLPGLIANVPASLANAGMDAAGVDWPRFPDQNAAVSSALTQAGLPSPETSTERVVGDISRFAAGTGAAVKTAQTVANGAVGLTKAVAGELAAKPAAQVASAVGAGAAGGSVREAGGGPWEQFAASLIGGIAAPAALNKAQQMGQNVAGAVRRVLSPTEIDSQVQIVFERAGVDWRGLSEGARRSLVEDAKAAVYSGQNLDDAALRRLADFRAIGAKPLTGDITQDPGLISKQRNLAKQQANMGMAPGDDLSAVQNQNAKIVIDTIDSTAGSADDAYATGQKIIERVKSVDDSLTAEKNAAYTAARDATGQDIPLTPATFINKAREELDRQLKGKHLPAEISNTLDDISSGKAPFDVRVIDILKTDLATASRGAKDGNVRAAIKIVRDALEATEPKLGQFGGNQVVTKQAGDAIAAVSKLPKEALALLDKARKLSASQFKWRESAPFIEDALGGAEPDRFVQKHILNGTVKDLAAIRKLTGDTPALRDGVRAQLIEYLKKKGGVDKDITTYTSKGLKDALEMLGDRKLTMWFTPQELSKLKSAINVARYSQGQTIGSAVGNSNTGAVVVAKALDGLNKWAAAAPLGIGTTVSGVSTAVTSRQLQNIDSALRIPQKPTLVSPIPLSLGAIGAAVPPRDKDSRN